MLSFSLQQCFVVDRISTRYTYGWQESFRLLIQGVDKMHFPFRFSDNLFLDALRDILRDTLTTISIMTIIVVSIKRLSSHPDMFDIIFLILLSLIALLICCWNVYIINRSILTLESMFDGSKYKWVGGYITGIFGCIITILLAFSISSVESPRII